MILLPFLYIFISSLLYSLFFSGDRKCYLRIHFLSYVSLFFFFFLTLHCAFSCFTAHRFTICFIMGTYFSFFSHLYSCVSLSTLLSVFHSFFIFWHGYPSNLLSSLIFTTFISAIPFLTPLHFFFFYIYLCMYFLFFFALTFIPTSPFDTGALSFLGFIRYLLQFGRVTMHATFFLRFFSSFSFSLSLLFLLSPFNTSTPAFPCSIRYLSRLPLTCTHALFLSFFFFSLPLFHSYYSSLFSSSSSTEVNLRSGAAQGSSECRMGV